MRRPCAAHVEERPPAANTAHVKPAPSKRAGELLLSTQQVRERIVQMPALLTYSLVSRYHPRLARCVAAGAPTELVLDRVTYRDDKFNASVPMDVDAWTIFEQGGSSLQ